MAHFRAWKCKNSHLFPYRQCPNYRFLDFVWDLYLKSLDFIENIPKVEMVQLFHTSKVEEWPDSSKLKELHTVYIENANRLTDFRGLAKAPNLRCLHIFSKTKLSYIEPFLDCKSLKYMLLPVTKAELKEAKRMFPQVQFNDDVMACCSQYGAMY